MKKTIDKVTTKRLDIALRMCNIEISYVLIDKIIDLVELIEEKGGKVSIKDICNLRAEWEISDELNEKLKKIIHD